MFSWLPPCQLVFNWPTVKCFVHRCNGATKVIKCIRWLQFPCMTIQKQTGIYTEWCWQIVIPTNQLWFKEPLVCHCMYGFPHLLHCFLAFSFCLLFSLTRPFLQPSLPPPPDIFLIHLVFLFASVLHYTHCAHIPSLNFLFIIIICLFILLVHFLFLLLSALLYFP